MMKNFTLIAAFSLVLLTSAMPTGDGVITKDGKTSIVNTTTLTKSVRGFAGPTPVKIYIKGNKIQKVEALKNKETPQYFTRAKAILAKFEGTSINNVENMQVDAKTGATFSIKALVKNVQEGVKYYKAHK